MVTENLEMFRCQYRRDRFTVVEERVFGVRSDKHGYPQFLIYVDNQWRWVSAKRFEPIVLDDKTAFIHVDLADPPKNAFDPS